MKNSGIDWIGEVPEDWEEKRIKYTINFTSGGKWGDEPKYNNLEPLFYVLRVADFDYQNLTCINPETIRTLQLDEDSPLLLRKDDLVIEKSGGGEKTPVGRVIRIKKDFINPTIFSNFTNVIRANTKIVIPQFLNYLFSTLYTSQSIKKFIKQTTGIQNLDLSDLFSQYFVLPTIEKQKKIADYLDKKTEQIHSLIENNEKKIELLEEHRSTLISNVVTGKIRVY